MAPGIGLDFRAVSTLDTIHSLSQKHRNNRAAKRPECSAGALGRRQSQRKFR